MNSPPSPPGTAAGEAGHKSMFSEFGAVRTLTIYFNPSNIRRNPSAGVPHHTSDDRRDIRVAGTAVSCPWGGLGYTFRSRDRPTFPAVL